MDTDGITADRVPCEWKKQILKNYKRIIQDTNLDETLLIDELLAEGVFTQEEYNIIRNVNPSTPQNKNRYIVHVLLRKDETAYNIFLQKLLEVGYPEIVEDIIKTCVAKIDTDPVQAIVPEENILRRQIFNNYKTIVSEANLDYLLDEFISKMIFDMADREKIDKVYPNTTNSRNTQFLDILFSKRTGYKLLLDEIKTSGWKDLIEKIRKTEAPDSVDSEIEDHLKTKNGTKALHDGKIQRWFNEDRMFYETCATKHVRECVISCDLTAVSGPPGAGKTAISHHIALELQVKGYNIVPVSTIKDVVQYWNPLQKQIFLLDDTFGVHSVDEIELRNWDTSSEDLEMCLRKDNTKIILTARKQIVNDKRISELLASFKHRVVDICDPELRLKNSERENIFKNHMDYNGKSISFNTVVTGCALNAFPLLCQVFAADKESRFEISSFFDRPVSVLKKDIIRLRENDKRKYFCLLLCMIYDNNLSESVLDVEDEIPNNKLKRKTFLELCGLSRSTSRMEIKSNMNALLGTYIIKESRTYRFIHDIIYDVVISSVPAEFHQSILKHASSKFVGQRILFPTIVRTEVADCCLVIGENLEEVWGQRIWRDLVDGNSYDVFCNKCLESKKYDKILAETIEQQKIAVETGTFICTRNVSYTEDAVQKEIKKLEMLEFHNLSVKEQMEFDMRHSIYRLLNSVECTPFHLLVSRGIEETFMVLWSELRQSSKLDLVSSTNFIFLAVYSGNENIIRVLLDFGADVNTSFKDDGRTLLFVASYCGHVQITKTLLERGADVDKSNDHGMTPLNAASYIGHAQIVKLLLENHADPNICDKNGCTPSIAASYYGHYNILKLMVQSGANINKCNKEGSSPLLVAAENGNKASVEILIDSGADINMYNKHGSTPIYATSYNGKHDVVMTLIDHGADVHKAERNGWSPIFAAADRGHHNVVQLLIEKGADINMCNNDKASPIYGASYNGFDNVVKILIDNGADLNTPNKGGWTALFAAADRGNERVLKLLIDNHGDIHKRNKQLSTPIFGASYNGHATEVQMLIDAGADVNKYNNCKWSPVFAAANYDHTEIVKILVDNGADVNQINNRGLSPLFAASECGYANIVQILTDNGADINKCDNEGKSPLYAASDGGHEKIVQILISKGADLNKATADGLTPLTAARDNGHEDVVQLLIQHKPGSV